MERIVILKGPSVDAPDDYILTECLRVMLPDCDIQIQSARHRKDMSLEPDDRPGRQLFGE